MNIMEIVELKRVAKFDARLNVIPDTGFEHQVVFPYPFMDGQTRQVNMAAARSFSVTGGAGFHSVILAARQNEQGSPDFYCWCGDAYLEGRRDLSAALSVASSIPSSHPKKSALVQALRDAHGRAQANGGCNFWARWNAKKGPCKHVDAALLHIDDIEAACDELARALNGWVSEIAMSPAARWLLGLGQSSSFHQMA